MSTQVLKLYKSGVMSDRNSMKNQLYLVEDKNPVSKKDPDMTWVHLAKNGDSKAFDVLFTRNYSRVMAMCSRMLFHKGEVEDAVQQTFFKAWQSITKFEERSLFSTWLTRIAMYTCLNIRRRLKRLFLTDEPLDYLHSKSDSERDDVSADKTISDKGYLKACDEVLQKLSVKRRAVFVLSELEDYRCSEIAEILNVPATTVRTRLFHARKDFAKYSKDNLFFKEAFSEQFLREAQEKGLKYD